MSCFAERRVLSEQKMSSSGSGVRSSQATAGNRCFKPRAAPGHRTAPASARAQKPRGLSPGCKFCLVEMRGLLLGGSWRRNLPRRTHNHSVQPLLPHETSPGVGLDGADTRGATETSLSVRQ